MILGCVFWGALSPEICVAIGWMLAHSSGGAADLKKCFQACRVGWRRIESHDFFLWSCEVRSTSAVHGQFGRDTGRLTRFAKTMHAHSWNRIFDTGSYAEHHRSFPPDPVVFSSLEVDNLSKFAHIGMIYALGDIFEMESVNYIDSSTYTVLSQSKLIITATLTLDRLRLVN